MAEDKVLKKTISVFAHEDCEHVWILNNMPQGRAGNGLGVRHDSFDLWVILPSPMNDLRAHAVTAFCFLSVTSLSP